MKGPEVTGGSTEFRVFQELAGGELLPHLIRTVLLRMSYRSAACVGPEKLSRSHWTLPLRKEEHLMLAFRTVLSPHPPKLSGERLPLCGLCRGWSCKDCDSEPPSNWSKLSSRLD